MRVGDNLRMWARRWWRGEGGTAGIFADWLLLPAEVVFSASVRARNELYDRGIRPAAEASIPVVSIGNLTVGGTGKTPVTAWLARQLLERGRSPAVVLRGYGEDEVRLHAQLNPKIPIVASARRVRSVEEAARAGADCALLDDGFQHRALARELDIVLVAAERWSSARRMLPRGPYREAPSALRRAEFVIVTRKTATRKAAEGVVRELGAFTGADRGIIHFRPDSLVRLDAPGEVVPIEYLNGRDLLAVTSLAEPELFVDQIRECGASVESLAYPDHHTFGERDLRQITDRGRGRTIVISQKEAVKLSDRLSGQSEVLVLRQRVEMVSGRDRLEAALHRAIGGEG